jgi:hypothetical protein
VIVHHYFGYAWFLVAYVRFNEFIKFCERV